MSNSFQEVLADEVREILSRPDDRSDPNYFKAVRHIRNSAGLSLKEARDFVGRIRATQQPSPAPQVAGASEELTDAQVDAAARVIAERMDYPWQHMPEQGRDNMRSIARAVLAINKDQS